MHSCLGKDRRKTASQTLAEARAVFALLSRRQDKSALDAETFRFVAETIDRSGAEQHPIWQRTVREGGGRADVTAPPRICMHDAHGRSPLCVSMDGTKGDELAEWGVASLHETGLFLHKTAQ
jgi:hypothetical protein